MVLGQITPQQFGAILHCLWRGDGCRVFSRAKIAKYNVLIKFLLFSLGGAILEFLCGILQELVFGARSWDYGGAFYGFVNLEMTLIWGFLGVVFSAFVTPFNHRFVGLFSSKFWRKAGMVFTVLLLLDFLVTSLAVWRWHARLEGVDARNQTEIYLDTYFGNERMTEIFPNMEFRKLGE